MKSGIKQAGFTIIETMLFLGVTGLIMSFMLVGVGTQLNQRRYQDASTSLVTYIQTQYSLVSNVNNSRDEHEVCIGSTVKVDASRSTVGTSDCTIVGRVLRTVNDGQGIKATPVIATVDAAKLPLNQGDSDIKVLHDASLTPGLVTEMYTPQWGTQLVQVEPDDNLAATFSILIVRMPTSGVVHTFVSTNENISLSSIVDVANQTDFRICLGPNGLLGALSRPTGVLLKADASNTAHVEFVASGECK